MTASEADKTTKASSSAKKARSKSAKKPKATSELDSPELYLNRELTWLEFSKRVLHEAEDERTPLLERVKFLAITGSNLDEFFMKRIGGLKQQLAAGVTEKTIDGRTPGEQLRECCEVVRKLQKHKQALVKKIVGLLAQNNIEIVDGSQLSSKERKVLRDEYAKNIHPLVTPQSIDPAHPFPFISNLSLNLLVTLQYPGERETCLARVKVPIGDGASRFLRVGDGDRFVPLEDVIAQNLDMLFPEMSIVKRELFRVTRNANTEKNEENADDLLSMIESELLDRKFAPIVRLEAMPDMCSTHRGFLAAELGLDEEADVFEVDGMLGVRDLMELAALDRQELKNPPHHPIDHPVFSTSRNIFHLIRETGPILLQHPYEAFSTSVERFLKEAATDPKVRAIKMTLYRTSSESEIVDYLITAAENGKQVAVAVELKASFDEKSNIRLAALMEEAGIHVTYGVVGLKTHAKLILVVRRDYDGLRRYVHIGTGNYHPITSRIYSDLGLLTIDDDIGADATELFNYLTTGFTPKRQYKKLLIAPKVLKKELLRKIQREIDGHSKTNQGHLRFKMNALEDADVSKALYAAVDLIVRDSCRVRPGIAGLSESMRVVSIVGRFLEHCRIYYFRNGGAEEYFIGSADAMSRNLEHRVEAVAPVESPKLRKELKVILETQLNDRRSAWEMQSDGTYVQQTPNGTEENLSSHDLLTALAEKRKKASGRLKKRKSLQPGGRNLR